MAPTSTAAPSGLDRSAALAQAGHLPQAELGEGVRHRLLDQHALGADADLTAVGEGTPDRRSGRARQIGILQHDERRLAAQLEHAGNQPLPAATGDLASHRLTAGEENHVGGFDQRLPDLRRPARTWNTFSGRPSSRHKAATRSEVRGVTCDGFNRTALPASSGATQSA